MLSDQLLIIGYQLSVVRIIYDPSIVPEKASRPPIFCSSEGCPCGRQLDEAQSELIVRDGYGVFSSPDAVLETIRILHLEQSSSVSR